MATAAKCPNTLPLFFWDTSKAGALTAARNFQRKMNNAGYNVPILRLNFANATGDIFSYDPADQAIAQ